ncbi:MAG: hypothetical protein EXS10_04960 [Phycisphaerales bacterium]|nr:hypothetical protein [Phycisphaerales bacterium]
MKILGLAAALAVVGAANASFTGYTVVSSTVAGYNVYQVFGSFNGATDTVLNAFQIHALAGSSLQGFVHVDAITGGVPSTTIGTWNPQFVLVPGAADSFVCIGGGTGFSSGNATNGDPGWGTAGLNQTGIPDGATAGVAGWFNSNPPNLQGRVNSAGNVLLAQMVLAAGDTAGRTFFMKVGYNNGIAGSPVQFGEGLFSLPTPGAVALLGLAGLVGRRRRA